MNIEAQLSHDSRRLAWDQSLSIESFKVESQIRREQPDIPGAMIAEIWGHKGRRRYILHLLYTEVEGNLNLGSGLRGLGEDLYSRGLYRDRSTGTFNNQRWICSQEPLR